MEIKKTVTRNLTIFCQTAVIRRLIVELTKSPSTDEESWDKGDFDYNRTIAILTKMQKDKNLSMKEPYMDLPHSHPMSYDVEAFAETPDIWIDIVHMIELLKILVVEMVQSDSSKASFGFREGGEREIVIGVPADGSSPTTIVTKDDSERYDAIMTNIGEFLTLSKESSPLSMPESTKPIEGAAA